MKVLVTEDDAITRRVLQLFLSPYGEVATASSGEEAIQLFLKAHTDSSPFDLICLDIGLPGQRGLEVLKELREIEAKDGSRKPVPVIMLTGASEEDQISRARELGATKYLLKPVIESELNNHLKELGFKTS